MAGQETILITILEVTKATFKFINLYYQYSASYRSFLISNKTRK